MKIISIVKGIFFFGAREIDNKIEKKPDSQRFHKIIASSTLFLDNFPLDRSGIG